MDYYSRWLEIAFMSNTSANTVITKLRVIFATHGLPDELRSDNGPQFASGEFQRFVNEMDIKHVTSSPHFPQSNGLAESGVKIAKHILQQSDWTSALMIYRATPHSSTNVSPAEALLNRKIRTQVPMLESQLMSNRKLHKKIFFYDADSKSTAKLYFDRHHGAKTPLPNLSPGSQVLLKDDNTDKWTTKGTVVGADIPNRTYLVSTPSGVKRRNRKHLQFQHVKEPNLPTPSPPDERENSSRKSLTSENIPAPPINSEHVVSPPSSQESMTTRPITRSASGFTANKPRRYREEE
ncbi:Pol polyprotein [Plakobranchus ocellatus]|uniref:Pol polyprotein n=1 Tax=Plakobranchus ocellatus TaxID=259542 RepID=A0AAV4CSU6_9GAST|nr:Pol polyprotein [Plakobranchus ocellatus]